MVSRKPKIRRYWDATCFLALLNGEEDAEVCERILNDAKRLATEICVSPMVQIEVVRPKSAPRPLAVESRERIRAFFENDYIKWRIIDRKISNDAQKLCWDHPLHPRDAVHLAVALDLECDLLETADKNLLNLDQQVLPSALRICRPGTIGQATLF